MLIKKQRIETSGTFALIPLWDGGFAKVDPSDYEWLMSFKWFVVRSKYCEYVVTKRRRDGRIYYITMHRLIMQTPHDQQCHHVNSDTYDNRRCNLRNVTALEHKNFINDAHPILAGMSPP